MTSPPSSRLPGIDQERRARLLGAKLAGLARAQEGDAFGERDAWQTSTFVGAAAIERDGRGWVLVADRPVRALGTALAWAWQRRLDRVEVVVDTPPGDSAPGIVARRAAAFTRAPGVWRVAGDHLEAAEAAPVTEPVAPPSGPAVAEVAETLLAAGAEPVFEHGVLVGEVEGLEVARVEQDPDGSLRIAVGVGRHDRDAFAVLHGDNPTPEALAAVVASVAARRRPGAEHHPLGRLAPERALRSRLVRTPELVGASVLTPAPPPVPRTSLVDTVPAVASGVGPDGEAVVVVCSVGIDVDLVPFAADARLADGRDARLVLAVPARDAHPMTRALAASLRKPAEVVAIAPEESLPPGEPAGR